MFSLIPVNAFVNISPGPGNNSEKGAIPGNTVGYNGRSIENYNIIRDRTRTIVSEWARLRNDYVTAKKKVARFNRLGVHEREDVIEKIKAFMDRTIERMDLHLNILESWANRISVTEERRDLILEEIEKERNELEQYKTRMEETDDLAELRTIAQEIKQSWREFLPKVKKISGELLAVRIGTIIERTENLSEFWHEKLDELDQDDTSVIEMQELLNDFDEKLELAKEKYELAKEKYQEIDSLEDANQLFQETKEFLLEARDYLREAHLKLKELIQKYYELEGKIYSIDETNKITETEIVDGGVENES